MTNKEPSRDCPWCAVGYQPDHTGRHWVRSWLLDPADPLAGTRIRCARRKGDEVQP